MAPPLPPMPNPYDPANDWWWEAYDLLDTIAMHAATISTAARAARDRWRAGDDSHLPLLAEQLRCWIWESASLDIIPTTARHDRGGQR